MKKSLLAVAALSAMFIASCSEPYYDVNDPKSLSKVRIYVETPEFVSRAYGDGTNATDLYYGVYDAQGNLVSAISKVDDNNKEEINISKTLNLSLVTGNTYSMILWADNADDVCDVDFENKVMSGTAFCRGRTYVYVLLVNAIRILLDKKLYKVIHKLKNGGDGNGK